MQKLLSLLLNCRFLPALCRHFMCHFVLLCILCLIPDLQSAQSQILAVFGQFGPFLGTPGPKLGSPPNSQLVWKSQHICPVPRSNFVPRRSNRFGPPEPSKSDFGRFGAIWTLFWSILGPGGPKSGPRSGHSLERGLGYPDRWEISVCSHQTLKKFRTPPLSP